MAWLIIIILLSILYKRKTVNDKLKKEYRAKNHYCKDEKLGKIEFNLDTDNVNSKTNSNSATTLNELSEPLPCKLKSGDKLFHKYLSLITVREVFQESFNAFTNKGLLIFKKTDFGKVIFYQKEDMQKKITDYDRYYNENIVVAQPDMSSQKPKFEAEYKNEKGRVFLDPNFRSDLTNLQWRSSFQTHTPNIELKTSDSKNNQQQNYSFAQFQQENSFKEKCYSKAEKKILVQSDNNEAIKRIIKSYSIEKVIHFTRVENLEQILKYGLLSIDDQLKYRVTTIRNDDKRLDGKTNYTCFSISYPNDKLFHKFRDYQYPDSRWVVIILNPRLIVDKFGEVLFYETNAAAIISKMKSITYCKSIEAFEKMFSRENYIDYLIPSYYTTDVQAEMLIRGVIEPEYFNEIHFMSKNDLEQFNNNINTNFFRNVKLTVSREYFGWRR